MSFEPQWQWADMCPSWARWLPCSVHSLRIVPDQHRFPRQAWDQLSDALLWDDPAWCDPGDPDDWIAQAVASHDAGEAEHAAQHARDHYDARVTIRAERIELWTTMCQRAELPPPSTLSQLLECLIGLGLYATESVDGEPWLRPMLWRNPLEVLPFTFEEAADEAISQQYDRALLAGAGLRRCSSPPDDTTSDAVTVTASLREIGRHAEIPAGQVRAALALLATNQMADTPDADPGSVDLDTPISVRVPWPHYARTFDFEQLPGPEHLS